MPLSFVTVAVVTPVSTLVALMVTPGIKAPLESETVPPSDALLDWPKIGLDATKYTSIASDAPSFFIFPPVCG